MKLIVISPATPVPNEHEIISSLFKEGLEIFHIHKPDLSKTEIKDYIHKIPAAYQDRVVSHADFPKFHSLQELADHKGKYEYAFLSPVFDSISKAEYKSKFSDKMNRFLKMKPELIGAVSGKNIIALGGIDEDKIALVRKIGFTGVAVLGAIWNSKNPVEKFIRIKAKCEKKDIVS
jgi:thiamine-phosphate pyrophosphorylase